MRVGILGPLSVVAGGAEVHIGGARLRALLIRLSLDAGRVVTVEALSSALWPDRNPAQPANAVQTLVSRLRRALPALPTGDPVRSVAGGYRLDLPPDAVDALRFERLVHEARQALRDGDPQVAARRLREALGLWRGEALADVNDAPYAAAAAARLTELRLAATEDRIAADLASASVPPAPLVAELHELVSTYPLRERLRGLLLRALHADGRRAEALAAYEQVRRLLAEELGTDPGPDLRQAHRAVLRDEREVQAPRRPGGNLRAELTSFVGRAGDQQRIGQLLARERLVTLIGPGGAGKTRLATAVAAQLAEHANGFPGGAWLVELAPVSDPDEVPYAVIGALGLRETGLPEPPDPPAAPRDPVGQLVEALAATETLLVLDNCEHLLDPVARLLDGLLGRCARLRVLATSREPLGILGEVLSPVPPLRLPPPGAPAAEAATSPAIRLFTDRAAAVRPDFALTDHNVAAVVDICRRLDGLPLAIELAAARLRSLTLTQVADRLDDRFRLLTGGSRTAIARHQTLRAVVAWSWQLLEAGERRVAQRLAVFPGGFTAAAAAQVCAPGQEPPPAIVDTLAALVDKSLLQLREGSEARYRMLETIREYGWERLVEAGELTEVRASHAAYHLSLAERAAPHLRGAGQLPWLARLRADSGSDAAFGFAHDTGDTDTLVRLAAALGYRWTIQGNHGAAARRLRIAREMPGEAPPPARALVAAYYVINTVLSAGQPPAAIDAEKIRPNPDDPASAMVDAMLALMRGETSAGLAATDPWLDHPDAWTRAVLWLMRSWLHGNDGAMDALRRDLTAAVAAFRDSGERWGMSISLTHRAHAQITLGEFDDAIAALAEAIRLLRALDPTDDAIEQRVLLAAARAQAGDRERARAELREIVDPGARVRSARNLVLARISLGDLARLDGDLTDAARHYDAAEADLNRMPVHADLLRAMLQGARGHLAVARDEPEPARWHIAEALALAAAVPDMPVAADIGVAAAALQRAGGDAAGAAEALGAAHALRGSPDAFDPDVVRLVQQLQAALGTRAYQAAYRRGRRHGRASALGHLQALVHPSLEPPPGTGGSAQARRR